MKSYLHKKGISIRNLSKLSNIPYSTLNDIVNGKTDIGNVKFSYVKSIAAATGLTTDELERLFSKTDSGQMIGNYSIIKKNKSFYLKSELSDKPIYLCKNNQLNSEYISEIASWEYAALQQKELLSNWK